MNPNSQHPVATGPPRRVIGRERHGLFHLRFRLILEEEPDAPQLARIHLLVGFDRFLEWYDFRYERLKFDPLPRQEVDEAREIAAFGPPHVADGIVDTLLLVQASHSGPGHMNAKSERRALSRSRHSTEG